MVMERLGDRALTFVWRNKGALTATTVLETFLADPEACPQCLLARCLPQREHDRHACARRVSDRSAQGKGGRLARQYNSSGNPFVRADPNVVEMQLRRGGLHPRRRGHRLFVAPHFWTKALSKLGTLTVSSPTGGGDHSSADRVPAGPPG